MSSPTTNNSVIKDNKSKSKLRGKKWPDRDIIDAQVLFLQGNDAKQIEAMIDMPERSVNRFVGRTPDDPRRSVDENTKTSLWHDDCWERALDQFAKIRNIDRKNKGLGALPREDRQRRSDQEVTGFDHPRNKARDKAKADAKAKVNGQTKAKSTTITPLRMSVPKSPTEGGVGPIRTSPTGPRASAFGVVPDQAQAIKDQIAARKAKKEGNSGVSAGSSGSGNSSFGTSSIRSTLGNSTGSLNEIPLGLEAYSRLGLGDMGSPTLGRSQLRGEPVATIGGGSNKENKA